MPVVVSLGWAPFLGVFRTTLTPLASPCPAPAPQPHVHGTVPHESEGWEFPYALTAVGAIIMGALMLFRPMSNPYAWGREEGAERLQRCGSCRQPG